SCFRRLLLAPAVGFAVILLAVSILNRAGLPVGAFAWPLTAALVVEGVGILIWRRGTIPVARLAPFGLAALVTMVVVGWPSVECGFEWLSVGNDDMANYVLGGQRFLSHGFYQVPDLQPILQGTDYSLYYWFFHVPGMSRAASEQLVAWTSGLSGLAAYQVFMA